MHDGLGCSYRRGDFYYCARHSRVLLAGGLVVCAAINYAFAMSSSVTVFVGTNKREGGGALIQVRHFFLLTPVKIWPPRLSRAALWALNGFFQGAQWPPVNKMIMEWFPRSGRGVVWGIASTAKPIASAVMALVCASCL